MVFHAYTEVSAVFLQVAYSDIVEIGTWVCHYNTTRQDSPYSEIQALYGGMVGGSGAEC